jgi:Cyclin-dependent kinase regulatory subunit
MLPKDMLKAIPKDYFDTETGTLRILQEEEWRSLGITQVRTHEGEVNGRALGGHIMRFMFLSRIFFYSSLSSF